MILYDGVGFELSFSNAYCFFVLLDEIMNIKTIQIYSMPKMFWEQMERK